MQPAILTFIPVTEPGAKLLNMVPFVIVLKRQVVPLSILYSILAAGAGVKIVTLPVVGPQSEGCTTQNVGGSGIPFTVMVTSEVDAVHGELETVQRKT